MNRPSNAAPRSRSKPLLLAAVACLSLVARSARADEAGTRVVFLLAEGSDARQGGDAVRAALPPGATVADDASTQQVFASAQLELPLGARTATPQARKALAQKLQRALDKHPGSFVIVVVSPPAKASRRGVVEVLVVGAGKGGIVADQAVDTSRKDDKLKAILGKALSGGGEPAREIAPSEPAGGGPAAPPSAETPAPAPARPPGGPEANVATDGAPPADAAPAARGVQNGFFVAEVAVGTIGRHFAYRDQLSKNLRPYDLLAAPSVAAGVEVYPLASTRAPLVRGLGLFAAYELAFALSSKLPAGETLSTRYNRFQLGAKLRAPLGDGLVGGDVSYKDETFAFGAPADPAAPFSPSVHYRAVRGGLLARLPAGAIAVLVAAGYDRVLQIGDLGDAFPHARGAGVDAEVGVAVPVSALFELRAGLRYERYFYAFHPRPGDAYVAGGALDQLFGVHAGAAFVP